MRSISVLILMVLSITSFAQIDSLWLRYPAISPDGSTIAFSYKGDIYTVPSNGGTATPLTMHPSYDYMPVWSHDGNTLAFASDRNGNFDVYVIPSAGGAATRLTYHSTDDQPSDFSKDNSKVYFYSDRTDEVKNQMYPTGGIGEFYEVPVVGGREVMLLTTPAINAKWNSASNLLVYEDIKGYENYWRKHHTSSVTRDIWIYNLNTKKHEQLSPYKGEDLSPVFSADGQSIYYLSEIFGNFNIVKQKIGEPQPLQVSYFKDHPVRQLTISKSGLLCFNQHGELYTMRDGGEPTRVNVRFIQDVQKNPIAVLPVTAPSEFAVAPNGKEIAFIFRGEVFVASMSEGTTKRITYTPEQERNVSFSPDSRTLLYAGERDGSWKVYTSSLTRKEEMYFFTSTIVQEELLISSENEVFQPSFSPDGKEIAYLEDRTSLKVFNIASKQSRLIVPAKNNYSYADGDQHYEWSPDGKWFLVNYLPGEQWISQIGLVSADGKGEIRNLSESGYGADVPTWMMKGKMAIWFSSKDGMKNHASWGGQSDVYASFFTAEAFEEFKMSEEEYALYKETKEKLEKEKEPAKEEETKKKKGKKEEEKKEEKVIEPLKLDVDGFKDRKVRLTIHSSNLSSAYVTDDGSKLFYIGQVDKDYNLWQTNLRTKETKVVTKLGGPGAIVADTVGKQLLVYAGGAIMKVNMESGEMKPLPVGGEMTVASSAEREYLFHHIWRQVEKKFFVENLQGVRWDFYKKEYARKVKDIANEYDFAELMSELMGELNASHTGAYNFNRPDGDRTASLAVIYDQNYRGEGVKVAEVLLKNPVFKSDSKVKAGVVIEKIDGQTITAKSNYYNLLNKKEKQQTLLSLFDPSSGSRWEEVVKPVNMGYEFALMYERWVERCRFIVDSVSKGELGYVHVRGMDDRSYRVVYDQALGKNAFKKGLVVDTRFNGGGWLHDDLATFLSGKPYMSFFPRGQKLGNEPQFKWTKKSCVVMNEGNYSDAHLFPYTYKTLGIGPLVGTPVAGTGTAVWWEVLQNGVMFGIPQVATVDLEGRILENQELMPDYEVQNTYETVTKGRDLQLEKACEVLLK